MSKTTYTGNISSAEHSYPTPGNYNVKIDDGITKLVLGSTNLLNKTMTSIERTGPKLSSFGTYCFCNAVNLSSISSESVSSIEGHCFRSCPNLERIYLPNLTSFTTTQTFYECNKLSSIYINNQTLSSINDNTVVYSPSRNAIVIAVPTITEYSNSDVTALTSYSFAYSNISSISLPNVSLAPLHTFRSCSALTQVDMSNLTSIGAYCFGYCSSLSDIYLPNLLTASGTYTFRECESLVSVDFPKYKTLTMTYMFYYCTSLTSIHIPELTSIRNSFQGCENLSVLDFSDRQNTSIPTLLTYSTLTDWIHPNFKVLVPSSLYSSWIAATNWSTITSHIVAV